MGILVQQGIGGPFQQALTYIQASYMEHLSCGVILAPCKEMNAKLVDQLKDFIVKPDQDFHPYCYYDEENRILWVVLDEHKLSATHYTSLLMKEFLQNHQLLIGKMGVASFPESGEPTESVLSHLVQSITAEKDVHDIHLYMDRSVGEDTPSILVVDSDEINREFVRLRLELKGYEVMEAKDGFEALEKYSQTTPDLVITELNLPILDGYQLISSIKGDRNKEGKVMVLTDKHLSKTMNRAFELGASDYITKPFSISELEWRIKKLVNY